MTTTRKSALEKSRTLRVEGGTYSEHFRITVCRLRFTAFLFAERSQQPSFDVNGGNISFKVHFIYVVFLIGAIEAGVIKIV